MSRGLSTDIKNVLASNKFNLAVLIKFQFNTNYYYTNSYKTITFDSNNYISGGIILDLAEIKEEAPINTGMINVTLTNASTTILTDLLTYGHIDKSVSIYFAFLNDNSTVIDSPVLIFSGTTSQMKIAESASSATIVLGIGNHWARLRSLNGRNLTQSSQARYFTGDTIFNFRPQVDKPIIWGVGVDADVMGAEGGGRSRDSMSRGGR